MNFKIMDLIRMNKELLEEISYLKNQNISLSNKNKELKKQLSIGGVSNSLLKIELKSWEHTCGDGCCYTDGVDIFLNGEQLDEQNAEDSVNALTAVLSKLGYKFEIN